MCILYMYHILWISGIAAQHSGYVVQIFKILTNACLKEKVIKLYTKKEKHA